MNTWQDIWNKRSSEVTNKLGLEDLVRLDGFDTGAGAISADEWRAYATRRANEMGLQPGDSVFEIGCGAGAFSFVLQELGCKVAGVDYSTPLILAAHRAMPKGTWAVGSANALELPEQSYDAVMANSVFHYFPNEGYAQQVLRTILKAARRAVGIFDVPDVRLAAAAKVHRKAMLGEEEYRRRYAGLTHLALDVEWFSRELPKGWEISAAPQDIVGYGNNEYRFNVILKRHG